MREFPKLFLLCLSFLVLLFGCSKDFDDYYARPSSLADPIYQQLEARGNFTSLLKLIDKANYTYTLSSGGYWTLLAPNDDAFKTYLSEKGYSSVDDIDKTTASNIVRYLLIYNAYDTASIDNSQDGSGDDNNLAFRRKTSYYKWVYSDTTNGTVRLVIDRPNNTTSISANDNNNKFIPYFTENFFNTVGLKSTDYTYFYPNATFSSFNIYGGYGIGGSIFAENGYYLEINKVIKPLPSIYEYIKSKSEYSEFKSLLDRFATFTINDDFQSRYLQATGSNATVYHKYFNDTLAFSPNGESYTSNGNDAQSDCWSIVVPQNDVVVDFVTNVLAEYYDNDPAKVPNYIIGEFLNSLMWQTSIWPSNFNKIYCYLSEYNTLDVNSDITDKQILSNGILYGSNKLYKSRSFTSVYAQPFLNPDYAYMLKLITSNAYKVALRKSDNKFTMFMVTDSAYHAGLFSYSIDYSKWLYNNSSATTDFDPTTKINRDFKLQIVSSLITDVSSGSGTVETYGGECIKYNNGVVYASGNEDSSEVANVLSYRDYDNGRVYFIDKMLRYGQYSLYGRLRILSGFNPVTSTWGTKTKYYPFFKIFEATVVKGSLITLNPDSAHATITGISTGDSWTVLVPDEASLNTAMATLDSTNSDDANKYYFLYSAATILANTNPNALSYNIAFLKYHFLNKILLADGNTQKIGKCNTASKDLDGNSRTAYVTEVTGGLTVSGYDLSTGKKTYSSVTIDASNSNNLATRGVIHLVSGFLKYEY